MPLQFAILPKLRIRSAFPVTVDANSDISVPLSQRDDRAVRIPRNLLNSIASAIIQVPAWVVLALSGVLMSLIFWQAFTVRYSLARFGTLPAHSIATLNHMSAEG